MQQVDNGCSTTRTEPHQGTGDNSVPTSQTHPTIHDSVSITPTS